MFFLEKKMAINLRFTKTDFRELDVPNLLINIHCYDGYDDVEPNNRWCREIVLERWDHERWIPYEVVIENITNKNFFDFGGVCTYTIDIIYAVLNKEFWKGWTHGVKVIFRD